MTRTFTGRHMAAVMLGFFGIVVVVNVAMARLAIGTFGGVVVENSYLASQNFNRWLDAAAAENKLGWKAEAIRAPGGRLAVKLSGVPESGTTLTAVARHPLGRLPDHSLAFRRNPAGGFVSTSALPQGRWRLRLDVRADGRQWRSEADVR
jgi:nitrogen fixation protein FixH